MKVQQFSIPNENWRNELSSISIDANLFLLFISPGFNEKEAFVSSLCEQFPNAKVLGCSTAGEISDVTVNDDTISLTAIQMEKVSIELVSSKIEEMNDSYDVGVALAKKIVKPDLKHVMILSDGLNVNGADLVLGLKDVLPDVSITGGLAGDGADFNNTFVIHNCSIDDKMVVGLGFYGEGLNVGCSSKGGWDSFGIERLVTSSEKNVLFELDGKPALELYKSFLGEEAENLPSSGLLFPLSLRVNEHSKPVVRTILSVNEEDQSLTFAGNVPQGSYVRLMKANVDRLITGAEDSAKIAHKNIDKESSELAILISCVGRRLVLKQLVEEEVEVVRDVIGVKPSITGFYSYGEIAPFGEFSPCELHNQTMTITTLSEC